MSELSIKNNQHVKVKLSLNTVVGRIYLLTSEHLDEYFKQKDMKFKKACVRHEGLLLRLHYSEAHRDFQKMPENFSHTVNNMGANKESSEKREKRNNEILDQALNQLHTKLAISEASLELTKVPAAESLCFLWANKYLCGTVGYVIWEKYDLLRVPFVECARGHLIDHCYEGASHFLADIRDEHISGMMQSVKSKVDEVKLYLDMEAKIAARTSEFTKGDGSIVL